MPSVSPQPPTSRLNTPGAIQSVGFQYAEQRVPVKQGDTYASLSRQYYFTDEYAATLQKYNSNHPEARTQDQLAGRLVPGQLVFIPDRSALQSPSLQPIAPPLQPGSGQQGFGGNPTAPLQSQATVQYRVAGPGESLYSIAQKTLQNGNRWGDLSTLNGERPGLQDVPPGTILNLPAGAVVPPENRP